jgi:hypothetical protein
MKRSCSGWHGGDLVADLLKAMDQSVGGFGGVGAIEVGGAEVVPLGAVAQHAPSRGERRGGHGDDGLLGATARAQAMKLGLQLTALDLDGGPGRSYEFGLEPLTAAAEPGAAALARALVVARAQASQGQQVAGRDEARHVDADLGDHDVGADRAQARHRAQQLGGLAKRVQPKVHLRFDGGDGLVQRIDVGEVQLEHEALMCTDVSTQCFEQLGAAGLDARVDARSQPLGVGLAVDDGLQHRTPALAQDVAEHDAEPEVGVFEHLVDALHVSAPLAHELLARAGERAQLLHRHRRHEAGADQAVRQQVRKPHRVVDVGLAPGHVLHVRGVGQHQLEVAFQHMPYRLPVHAGGLHGDDLDTAGIQPIGQAQQTRGGRGEGAHFLQRRALAHNTYTRHHRLLVHVQSRAARADDFHDRLRVAATSACGPRHRNLGCVLRSAKPQATVRGAREAAGPTEIRARCTTFEPTSVPDAAPQFTATFHASRVARSAMDH